MGGEEGGGAGRVLHLEASLSWGRAPEGRSQGRVSAGHASALQQGPFRAVVPAGSPGARRAAPQSRRWSWRGPPGSGLFWAWSGNAGEAGVLSGGGRDGEGGERSPPGRGFQSRPWQACPGDPGHLAVSWSAAGPSGLSQVYSICRGIFLSSHSLSLHSTPPWGPGPSSPSGAPRALPPPQAAFSRPVSPVEQVGGDPPASPGLCPGSAAVSVELGAGVVRAWAGCSGRAGVDKTEGRQRPLEKPHPLDLRVPVLGTWHFPPWGLFSSRPEFQEMETRGPLSSHPSSPCLSQCEKPPHTRLPFPPTAAPLPPTSPVPFPEGPQPPFLCWTGEAAASPQDLGRAGVPALWLQPEAIGRVDGAPETARFWGDERGEGLHRCARRAGGSPERRGPRLRSGGRPEHRGELMRPGLPRGEGEQTLSPKMCLLFQSGYFQRRAGAQDS